MAATLTRLTHDTTAPSGRELYRLQFSLQAASSGAFWYTLVGHFCFLCVLPHSAFITTFPESCWQHCKVTEQRDIAMFWCSAKCCVVDCCSGWRSLGGPTARHASGASHHLRGPQVKRALWYCSPVCSQGKVVWECVGACILMPWLLNCDSRIPWELMWNVSWRKCVVADLYECEHDLWWYISTGYGAGIPGFGGSIPGGGWELFTSPPRPERLCGPPRLLSSWHRG
jgi:hypothetical protein